MGLRKGTTNNPNGRPPGKPNKITKTNREWLNDILRKNKKRISKDLDALTPYERLIILEKFISYTTPKKSSMELEGANGEQLMITLNLGK